MASDISAFAPVASGRPFATGISLAMLAVGVAVELLVDSRAKLRCGNSKTAGMREELADQPFCFGSPIALAAIRGDVLHERPRPVTRAHETLGFQVSIRLDHRRRIDAQLGGEAANGRQRFTG